MACIALCDWLRLTSGMVLFFVHVVSARILRATLTQKIFTSIFLSMVSCPAITAGPSTEKEEL
jgi:hypothetical protein